MSAVRSLALFPYEELALEDDLGPSSSTFLLRDLERLHLAARHELARPECFGDAILLERIPLLARLRQRILERGYRFVPASEMPAGYSVVPLLQLNDILEQRTIPFQRSTMAIRDVLMRAPDLRVDDLVFRDSFNASYLAHEGGHALAWELVREDEGEGVRVDRTRRVEVLVASEAMTMALESLATFHDLRRSTGLFLTMNAYADPFAYRADERLHPGLLRQAQALLRSQPRALFRYLAGAFLIANLRPTAARSRSGLADWLRRYAGLKCSTSVATSLIGIALGVSIPFRSQTAALFFRYLGCEEEFHSLCRARLERSFTDGAAFHDYVGAFAHAIFDDNSNDDNGGSS